MIMDNKNGILYKNESHAFSIKTMILIWKLDGRKEKNLDICQSQ